MRTFKQWLEESSVIVCGVIGTLVALVGGLILISLGGYYLVGAGIMMVFLPLYGYVVGMEAQHISYHWYPHRLKWEFDEDFWKVISDWELYEEAEKRGMTNKDVI